MLWLISMLISAYSADVEQLSHGRWHVRENASRRLVAAWPVSSVALLKAYPETSDPEIRRRIQRISLSLTHRLDAMQSQDFQIALYWLSLKDTDAEDWPMGECDRPLQQMTLQIMGWYDSVVQYGMYEEWGALWGVNWLSSRQNFQQKWQGGP